MADEVKELQDGEVEQHLDVDPNDPRNVVPAEPNSSDLNADDPEK